MPRVSFQAVRYTLSKHLHGPKYSARLRDKEVRLQEKIAELAREHKQVKGLANQVRRACVC